LDIVGYSSIWLLAFVGAALVFVPVGALAGVCVAASPLADLNPFILGIVCGSAEAVGELTGYAAGVGGKVVFNHNRFYLRSRVCSSGTLDSPCSSEALSLTRYLMLWALLLAASSTRYASSFCWFSWAR